MGSGDFAINGGAGNNTIYADNTGTDGNTFNSGRAVDVFNAKLNTSGTNGAGVYDPTNLLSDSRSLTVVANTTVGVTVSILGFEKTVNVVNAVGTTVITDLMINQAVKAAINLDPVLSKLVAVADGPARTLVLNWLIDGNMNIDPTTGLAIDGTGAGSLRDLTISLSSTGVASTAFDTAFGTVAGKYINHAGTDAAGNVTMTGQNSINPSDNLIDANTNAVAGGIDVIVLGTAGFHQNGDQMLGSNDTIAYQGFGGISDTIVNFDTTITPTQFVDNVATNKEKAVLTFSASDGTPAAETIIFDGNTLTLSVPASGSATGVIPANDVASQFVTLYNAATTSPLNWTATLVAGTNKVTLEAKSIGAVTDLISSGLTGSNFTGTYTDAAATGGGGVISAVTTVQGQNTPAHSAFTVTLDAPATAAAVSGAFTFNGTSVAYALGDGSVTLAAKLAAAAYTNWTAAVDSNNNSSVNFTAKAAGPTTAPVSGTDFIGIDTVITDGIKGVVSTASTGTGTSTTITGGLGQGFDYLDFTSYKVSSVQVHLAGVAPTTSVATAVVGNAGFGSANYLDLAENTTNAGFYTVTVRNSVDKTVVVGTVGTIDFGHTEAFVAQNFII